MKTFCTSLREHAKDITDFKKKKMLQKRIEIASRRKSYSCGKRILTKLSKGINNSKVRDYCHYTGKYRGAANSICNLEFNVPN